MKYLVVICLFAFLAGCVTTGSSGQPRDVEVPPAMAVSQDDLTEDQLLVMAAIIEKMRGGEDVFGVLFDPGGKHNLTDEAFRYGGFGVTNTILTGYSVVPLYKDMGRALLEGIFVFKDALGRRAGVRFSADYIISPAGLNVYSSTAAVLTPDFPVVETYFVPKKLNEVFAENISSWAELYLYTLENSIPLNVGNPDGSEFEEQDYTIMVFCKDRMAPWSKFDVTLAARKNGRDKIGDFMYLEDRGFRIAMTEVKFKPGSLRNKFYVHARYSRNPAAGTDDIVVGEFLNRATPPGTASAQ